MAPIANLTVKLSAQIAEFQSEFRKATQATEQFHKEFEGTATKVSRLSDVISRGIVAAFGAISVNAVKNWLVGVVDAASRIEDLSNKLGVSREAVQRWSHAAELSGASIDTVDRALSFMNKTLAEGDKSTIAALQKAGLSFEQIRAMRPEDAFNAIWKAIAAIEDPMIRAQVAMQLWGRTGQDLLPGIIDGSFKAAEGIKVMADVTIERLQKAGDQWTKFLQIATVHTGEAIGRAMAIVEGYIASIDRLTQSWAKFAQTVQLIATGSLTGFEGTLKALQAVGQIQAGPAAPKAQGVPQALTDTIAAVGKLNAAQKTATASAEAHAKAVERIRDSWLGLDAVKKLNETITAFEWQIPLQQLSADKQRELNVLVKDAIDVHERLGRSVPQIWREIYAETFDYANLVPELPPAIRDISDALREIPQVGAIAIPPVQEGLKGMTFTAKDLAGEFFKVGKQGSDSMLTLKQGVGELANALSNLANIAGGSFGAVASGVATVVGALDAAIKGVDAFKGGLSAFKDGSALAGIAGMATGIMGIVSAAIAAGKAIAGMLDRNKGRDLVEDFAASMGGFEILQEKLNSLGEEGRRLSELGTKIGRNNTKQAAEWIAQVEAALAKQQQANITTEAGAQATIETAAQAVLALDEVNARLVTNRDAWAAWSVDVTGFLQKLADDIRALPLPGPGGTMGGSTASRTLNLGSGGSAAPAFSGSSVSGGFIQHITTVLDGEVIARATARHMPSELILNGV